MIRLLYVGTGTLAGQITSRALTDEPTVVFTVPSCQQARQVLLRETVDFLLLEVELDDCNLCSYVRVSPTTSELPIICIGAGSEIATVLRYFQMGADDFVISPFDVEELIARIYAVYNRVRHSFNPATVIGVANGRIQIDIGNQQVRVSDGIVRLTRLEYLVLYHLAMLAGRPLTNDEILQSVWGHPPQTGDPALVRAQVKNLRRKFEKYGIRDWLNTVPGVGYQVVA